jgi:hypothetical protein
MSHFMIELYQPRPSWIALSHAARRAFLEGLVASLSPVLENGASAIALGAADPSRPQAAEHRFFALWQLRDDATSDDMVRITLASGWYDYFDTITAVGESCELPGHLEQLIAA